MDIFISETLHFSYISLEILSHVLLQGNVLGTSFLSEIPGTTGLFISLYTQLCYLELMNKLKKIKYTK